MLFTTLLLFGGVSFSQIELTAGMKAPPIQFQKAFPSEYTIPKNKPIILDFWATWCGPCVAGLIENNELVKKYQNQIEFIAITDTTSKKVVDFIQSRNFNHRFLIDKDTQTFSGYGVSEIPRAFLIDGDNVIQWSGYGRDVNEEMIKEFILTGTVITHKEQGWRYAYNDTSTATEVLRMVVVDINLLNTHKTLLRAKSGDLLGQFSNSPKAEGKLTVINYSLKELSERINLFFSTKKLVAEELRSVGYDFILLPFTSFEELNAHLKAYYGIYFK